MKMWCLCDDAARISLPSPFPRPARLGRWAVRQAVAVGECGVAMGVVRGDFKVCRCVLVCVSRRQDDGGDMCELSGIENLVIL